MVALVERFVAGEVSRHDLHVWAWQTHETYGSKAFGANGAAGALHACLCHLDETFGDAGEPLVRHVDLVELLRAVRHGEPRLDWAEVALLRLTTVELAARTQVAATRTVIDGLGWFETLQFASPATGRTFVALCPLRSEPSASASVHTTRDRAGDERAEVVADLFDTLAIDLDDVIHCQTAPARRWRLMRADDNGNREPVAEFSGYAKARAQLERFAGRAHKQVYWIDEVPTRPRTVP